MATRLTCKVVLHFLAHKVMLTSTLFAWQRHQLGN
jgi:hypothetical protein